MPVTPVRLAVWADSPEMINAVIEFLAVATRECGLMSTTARDVLGRHPILLADWAHEHAAAFR